MTNAWLGLALVTSTSALLGLGCGSSPSGGGSQPADMASGSTLLGYVGGEMPSFIGVHFGPDTTCGTRGVNVFFTENPDRGCSPASDGGVERNMQIFLSDFVPGTYALATSQMCPNTPGEKDFFATFNGNMNADNMSGFDSFKGTVTLDFYDHVTLSGNYDITFTLRKLGGHVDNGFFKGRFAGQHCP